VPFVVTFHSGRHNSTLRNRFVPIQAALLRPLLVRARRLIAVSEFEAGLFRRRLRLASDRITVIPNGADLPLTRSARPPRDRENLIVSWDGSKVRVISGSLRSRSWPRNSRHPARSWAPARSESIRKAAEAAGVTERVEIGAIGNDGVRL
jgi:hypothetical protein